MGKIDCVTIAFIEELVNQISAISASPGFTWGDSGNVNSNTFLLNDTVPSNQAGRMVPLQSGEITNIFVSNQDANTFTVEILKRTGPGTFTSLTTTSLVAQRTKTESKTGVSVSLNDELACKISAGAAKNPVVGVIIKGTT